MMPTNQTYTDSRHGNYKFISKKNKRNSSPISSGKKLVECTFSDGLLVVADIMDGGGYLPVERAANIEENHY